MTTLTNLKPEVQNKLLNWMARRFQEVLKEDRFDFCHDAAARLLALYQNTGGELYDLHVFYSELLVKSQTMTGKINTLTPAKRVLQAHELLNSLWLSVPEDKCIAVVQVLTEP